MSSFRGKVSNEVRGAVAPPSGAIAQSGPSISTEEVETASQQIEFLFDRIKEVQDKEKDAIAESKGWIIDQIGDITDEYKTRLDTRNEFNAKYQEMVKGQYEFEKDNIQALGQEYMKAGSDQTAVATWVAQEIKRIDDEKTAHLIANARMGTQQMSEDFLLMSETFGTLNEEMFHLYKASAIATTIISTYEGAQKAFTSLAEIPVVGPALGVAAAAAAIGAGMARVAVISSQQPGYEKGGVARGDSAGYPVTLHGTEAIVPLPNGRSIPVEMRGGEASETHVHLHLQAWDGQSVIQTFSKYEPMIVGMVEKAYRRRGQTGPRG
jgi:hypothetical protein